MLKRFYIKVLVLSAVTFAVAPGYVSSLVWPPEPDRARVVWLEEIKLGDLKSSRNIFGRIKGFLAGESDAARPTLPFDIAITDQSLFLTCQTLPALVEIDRRDYSYTLHKCKKEPIIYPISLCAPTDDLIFFTDSEKRAVYRFDGEKVRIFINSGLVRPTGIAADNELQKLFVVDTGDHTLKIYDYEGRLLNTIGTQDYGDNGFNFPTFIASSDSDIWVNDALNYRIKRFNSYGDLLTAFGQEGDGPGTFSRPKGIAVDSDEHIWVVDNLFDNVQLFNDSGDVMLVIGSRGRDPGQFWSPAGIDIRNDTVFIADTFNNRIQVLHYLGTTK